MTFLQIVIVFSLIVLLVQSEVTQVGLGVRGSSLGAAQNLAGLGATSQTAAAGTNRVVGQTAQAAVGQQAVGSGVASEAAQVTGVNGYTANAGEQAAAYGANNFNQNVGQTANAAQLACQTFVCVEWFDAQGLEMEKVRMSGMEVGRQASEGLAGYNQAALAGYGQRGLYGVGQARYAYQPYASAYGVNRGLGVGAGQAANYGGGYSAGQGGALNSAAGYGSSGISGVAPIPTPLPGYAPYVGLYGPGVGYGNYGTNYGAGQGLNSGFGSGYGTQLGTGYGANYGTGEEAARAYNAAANSGSAYSNGAVGQSAEAQEGTRAGAIKASSTNVAAGAATDRLAAYNKQGFKNTGKKCMRYQCFQNSAYTGYASAGPNYSANYGTGIGRASLQGAASNYGAAANQAQLARGEQAAYQSGPYSSGYGYGSGQDYNQGYGTNYGTGYGGQYGSGYGANYGAGVGGYPGYF